METLITAPLTSVALTETPLGALTDTGGNDTSVLFIEVASVTGALNLFGNVQIKNGTDGLSYQSISVSGSVVTRDSVAITAPGNYALYFNGLSDTPYVQFLVEGVGVINTAYFIK